MRANTKVVRNLRILRVRNGISQEALAVDAELDRTYVSRLERDMENPTVAVLEKLSGALGCQIGDLFLEVDGSALPALKPGRKPK